MNNKQRNTLIIGGVLVVLLVAGLLVGRWVLSFHTVTFTNANTISAVLTNDTDDENQKTVQTITGATEVQLQDGTYCLLPTDKKYSQSLDCFDVKGADLTHTIDFDYSKDTLAELLSPQQTTLNTMISATYKPLSDQYVLKDGELFAKGEWYAATLTTKVAAADQGDVYRVILHKEADEWKIAAYPQIVISKQAFPNIPVDIIEQANRLVGTY